MEREDYFSILGLPRQYDLDLEVIEKNYLQRSREHHPDYHQMSSTSEQRVSMEMTAALNEAYSTLRDPFRRAEYLLRLEGGPSASESKEMTPDFLEEMLELRMEIEEIRSSGDADSPELAQMEQQLQGRHTGMMQSVSSTFAELRSAKDESRQQRLMKIRKILNTARFIQGLIRDLRAD